MRPINLLPKGAAPRGPTSIVVVGAAIVVWLLALLVGTLNAQERASDAEARAETTARNIEDLRRQIAVLSEVSDTVASYNDGVDLIGGLLTADVSWGALMASLSSEIPSRVWLEGFSGTAQPSEGAPYGRITVSGVAFDFPDVSDWIRSLDADNFPGVSGAWVQSVSDSAIGEADVVVFSSTTSLTADALSGRVHNRVPEVR